MKVVEGLYYSEEHEWVKLDGDFAFIGITDYAQNKLGDIAFIEMPEVDEEFSAGDIFGTIESVKTVSDLGLPISGKIIAVNDDVESSPEMINSDPYENWIIKVEYEDKSNLDNLMNAKQYEEFTQK